MCDATSSSALGQAASRVFVWVWMGKSLPERIVWYPQCERFKASRLQGDRVGAGGEESARVQRVVLLVREL